jgi:hypothetical protein
MAEHRCRRRRRPGVVWGSGASKVPLSAPQKGEHLAKENMAFRETIGLLLGRVPEIETSTEQDWLDAQSQLGLWPGDVSEYSLVEPAGFDVVRSDGSKITIVPLRNEDPILEDAFRWGVIEYEGMDA